MCADGKNRLRLAREIVALSDSDSWESAKLEWDLAEVYYLDEPSTCLCGHTPIIEICVLRNRQNGNQAEVGNVCVNNFLGLESNLIFDGLRRILADSSAALNAAATGHAYDHGWITDWEWEFCQDTRRKRKLSSRQLQKRIQINKRVLAHTRRRKSAQPPPPPPLASDAQGPPGV